MRAILLLCIAGLFVAGCLSEAPTPAPPTAGEPTTSSPDYAPTSPSRIADCFEPGVAQFAPGGEEAVMVCLVKQAVESGDCEAYFSPANVARIDAIVEERFTNRGAESFAGVREEAFDICQGFILLKNALSTCGQRDIDALAAFAEETSGFSLTGSPGGIEVMLSSAGDCSRIRQGDETVCDSLSSSKREQCRITAQNIPQACLGDVDCLLGLALARLTPEPCRLVEDGEERARCFFFIDFFVGEDVCAWRDESTGQSVCVPVEDDGTGMSDGAPTETGFASITPREEGVAYPLQGPVEITFTNAAGDALTPVSALLEVPGGSCIADEKDTVKRVPPGDSFTLSFTDCPTPALGAGSVGQADVSVSYLLEKTGTVTHTVEGTMPFVVAGGTA